MPSARTHYSSLLAPVYSWMVGGADAAFRNAEADLSGLLSKAGLAVDLGAGFGTHSVPLARAGWKVLAVDSSAALLDELASHAADLPVTGCCDDLLAFAEHLPAGVRPDLILCMGDTLTHLDSVDTVSALIAKVAARLSRDGRFLATFRDYSQLPVDESRFIPVRSDDSRILTCFLEEDGDFLRVHDLLHERGEHGWQMKVSSYRKLRLDPGKLRRMFQSAGFRVTLEDAPRGMLRLLATF